MSLVIVPKITEKTLAYAGKGVYTFTVPVSTNKIEVARAVKEQFKVDVVDVRIAIIKGKTKRFRQVKGRRVNVKKAYVQLAPNQKISAFDVGQEEPSKDDKKASRLKKAITKAKKEEKK